jgi:hypothetical protein
MHHLGVFVPYKVRVMQVNSMASTLHGPGDVFIAQTSAMIRDEKFNVT